MFDPLLCFTVVNKEDEKRSASLMVLRNLKFLHTRQPCFLGLIHSLLDINDGLHVQYVTDLRN